jgi:hypothetical protein
MRTIAALGIIGLSLFVGCPSSSNKGSSATGSGSAGSGSSSSCFPPCFLSGVKECVPTGACASTQTGSATAECYDNGVKFCSPGAPPVSVTVTKSDGKTPCVTMDVTIDASTGSGTATYKSVSGQTFATATFSTAPVVKLTCGGQSYDVDRSKPGCSFGSGGIPGVCKTGACSCQ